MRIGKVIHSGIDFWLVEQIYYDSERRYIEYKFDSLKVLSSSVSFLLVVDSRRTGVIKSRIVRIRTGE